MSFLIYYRMSSGREDKIRFDAESEEVARERFTRMYSRRTILRVVNVTSDVRAGYHFY